MDQEAAAILAPFRDQRGALITILQKVQEKYGYLSEKSIRDVARFTNHSVNEVFGVASFYAQFYFAPRGRHTLKCCVGTACHVRGGERILDGCQRMLGTTAGSTTADGRFSIEKVACFGSCALGPVIVVDKDVYGRMTTSKIKPILDRYR